MIDDIDEKIIELLQADGRQGNREIGRKIGVSETTIRQRLKRLKEENIIRLGVVIDPLAMGLAAWAYVRIAVEPHAARRVCDTLAAMDECAFVAMVLGAYDVVALMVVRSRLELGQVVEDKVVTIAGVRSVDVREALGSTKHMIDRIWIK